MERAQAVHPRNRTTRTAGFPKSCPIFIASSTEINQGISVELMKKVKDELFSSAP